MLAALLAMSLARYVSGPETPRFSHLLETVIINLSVTEIHIHNHSYPLFVKSICTASCTTARSYFRCVFVTFMMNII